MTTELLLREVFSYHDLPSLHRLLDAIDAGRVIKGSYVDAAGSGCVMHILSGAKSRAQLEQILPAAEMLLANKLIRQWDGRCIPTTRLRTVLVDVISQREAIHAEEDSTLRQVCLRLGKLM